MNQAEFDRFSEIIEQTADAFSADLSENKIALYFRELADLSFQQVEAAFRQALKKNKFFPRISELREFAEGSIGDKAEVAWRTLFSLLSEGAYPGLWVTDRAFAYAIRTFGGWIELAEALRECSEEMLASYEKRFKTRYRLGIDKAAHEVDQYFMGWYEANNRGSGRALMEFAARTGSAHYKQPVCIVSTDRFVKFEFPFEPLTGALVDSVRLALQAGNTDALQQYLPSREPQDALPPGPPLNEIVTGEERLKLLAELRSSVEKMAGRRVPKAENLGDQEAIAEAEPAGAIKVSDPEMAEEAMA